jgi:hypothetical protein
MPASVRPDMTLLNEAAVDGAIPFARARPRWPPW